MTRGSRLDWLLVDFARATPGVRAAVVMSVDGLPLAASAGVDDALADQLSAAASGPGQPGSGDGAAAPVRRADADDPQDGRGLLLRDVGQPRRHRGGAHRPPVRPRAGRVRDDRARGAGRPGARPGRPHRHGRRRGAVSADDEPFDAAVAPGRVVPVYAVTGGRRRGSDATELPMESLIMATDQVPSEGIQAGVPADPRRNGGPSRYRWSRSGLGSCRCRSASRGSWSATSPEAGYVAVHRAPSRAAVTAVRTPLVLERLLEGLRRALTERPTSP